MFTLIFKVLTIRMIESEAIVGEAELLWYLALKSGGEKWLFTHPLWNWWMLGHRWFERGTGMASTTAACPPLPLLSAFSNPCPTPIGLWGLIPENRNLITRRLPLGLYAPGAILPQWVGMRKGSNCCIPFPMSEAGPDPKCLCCVCFSSLSGRSNRA